MSLCCKFSAKIPVKLAGSLFSKFISVFSTDNISHFMNRTCLRDVPKICKVPELNVLLYNSEANKLL